MYKRISLTPEVIRCDWGTKVMAKNNKLQCVAQAVQRIALYDGGEQLVVKVCEHHKELVLEGSDEHVFS